MESYTTPSLDGTPKLTKIVAIFKQQHLQEFVAAMEDIGVTGITVTNVLGCGIQRGQAHYYRGAKLEATLLPKVKAEIAVCKVPVEKVIETASAVLYTGNIGDGKLFIYDLETS